MWRVHVSPFELCNKLYFCYLQPATHTMGSHHTTSAPAPSGGHTYSQPPPPNPPPQAAVASSPQHGHSQGAGPPAGQPVEFNHAINYVNKIKVCAIFLCMCDDTLLIALDLVDQVTVNTQLTLLQCIW